MEDRLALTITSAILAKAVVMATTVYEIVSSNLSGFVKTLLITAVSASVTGLFTVVAAYVAARYARGLRSDVQDVKRHLSLDKRDTDKTDTE